MRPWFLGIMVIGILGVGFGFRQLRAYEETPGRLAAPPPRLSIGRAPHSAGILSFDTRRPTLFLLAHPLCPCTRASLDELAGIMTRCRAQLSATVLFVQPKGLEGDPRLSDLWRQAIRIPGVQAQVDIGGDIARDLGATTSGQVLLYSPQGSLLFCGGITRTRGQVGDNAGAAAVVSLVAGGTPLKQHTFPVFGCSLFGAEAVPER